MSNYTYYIVHARIDRVDPDGWESTRHLPAFLLCASILGLLDTDGAERAARRIVDPFGDHGDALTIHAALTSETDR